MQRDKKEFNKQDTIPTISSRFVQCRVVKLIFLSYHAATKHRKITLTVLLFLHEKDLYMFPHKIKLTERESDSLQLRYSDRKNKPITVQGIQYKNTPHKAKQLIDNRCEQWPKIFTYIFFALQLKLKGGNGFDIREIKSKSVYKLYTTV